jgi:GNAT superfamily N-acetyltransferase
MTHDRRPLFRTATTDDVPALTALRERFSLEDGPPSVMRADYAEAFGRIVRDGIESGRWTVWLAESDGEIVAHMYVGLIDKIPRPTPGKSWLGYLTNVYTRPEHRDQGIGSRLLDHVQTWAREAHVELLVVWPSEESVSFYTRAGFASGRDPLVWMAPDNA